MEEIFKTLEEIFGPSFPIVLKFHLKGKLNGRGIEALWDEAKAVYEGLSSHRIGEDGL